ncbi:hypothetical protein [Melaminivora alkalimesophila]|nr:hypothetical protein [Melaminivora alkalimesophila]
MNADSPCAPIARASRRLAAALAGAAWLALAGCAATPMAVVATPDPAPAPPAEAPAASAPATAAPAAEEVAPAPAAACPQDALLLAQALLQADRLRGLEPAALQAQIARPDAGPLPAALQQALALAQAHRPADTARALGLVQRVLEDSSAAPLHPLARLMETLLLQQRRLEDEGLRQARQLREAERRSRQLTARLEAMRALERSLNERPH